MRALSIGLAILAVSAQAEPRPSVSLQIDEQGFRPGLLQLHPALSYRLQLNNLSGRAIEFESPDLSREVIVPAHSQVNIFLPALQPGHYVYFDDFHPQNRGQILIPST